MNRRDFLTRIGRGTTGIAAILYLPPTWFIRRYPALTIEQITAIAYPTIFAESRRVAFQWSEAILLRELERAGAVSRVTL